jgi:hypothetical protein
MSNCAHCNGRAFEIEEITATGLTFNPHVLQCAGCKSPIEVIENNNFGQLISGLETRVAEVLRVLVLSLQRINPRLEGIGGEIKK